MKKKSKEEFISDAIKVHGDLYDYSLVEYINSKSHVKIVCKKHGIFEQKPNNHLNGQNCPKCVNNNIKITKEEFIKKSIDKFGNVYDYSLVEYINNKTKVKIICTKHGVFEQRPDNHFKHKIACKKCDSLNRLLKSKAVLKYFKTTHGDYYDYSKFEYKGRTFKSIIICPIHGEFKQTPHSHILGSGCKKCSQSNGEKLISSILKELDINFEIEFKFENCYYKSKLKFDFYLPSLNMCIEYNGLQHYQPVEFFGGEKYFNEIKRRDNIKRKYCEDNGINLLEIKYKTKKEEIINIISSYLQ